MLTLVQHCGFEAQKIADLRSVLVTFCRQEMAAASRGLLCVGCHAAQSKERESRLSCRKPLTTILVTRGRNLKGFTSWRIRKITSHVAGVAPHFSSKPHPATLPQTMVRTLYIRWRLSRHNHLWHHDLTIISLWGHKLSSELFFHVAQIKSQFCITTLYHYRNNT